MKIALIFLVMIAYIVVANLFMKTGGTLMEDGLGGFFVAPFFVASDYWPFFLELQR